MKLLAIIDVADPDKVNSALSGNLKNVVRWSSAVSAYSAGLGAAVTVQHDLAAVPNVLHVEPYVDSRWWADQDDVRVWTSTSVTFHTSHAGTFIVRAGVQ